MPFLQEHMLRVAGVSNLICDNFKLATDEKSIISACLLHDLGNIIKFKKNWYFKIFKKTDPETWSGLKEIKNYFIEKYGSDEHEATSAIIKEIGARDRILYLVKSIGFSNSIKIYNSNDLDLKIVAYSDHRVAPFGVTSLQERHIESRSRYTGHEESKYSLEKFDYLSSINKKIESQIFAHCNIKPEDITEEKVRPLIDKLRNFEIETQ
ncbi:hypothetical protein A2692_05260 [Candidatus Woesebacteria bacterium RIFCSPHIGHO2_01_FULL_39_95]|nr:Metal-dependent phosphohydrolase, HD subdomain [uncultured Microgenomates bacterium Rifle_16ft_4_minimus_37836]OGM28046.1 MAG: hypothetical protein A2692_05260 [Candidatus Woesebacteria bacterium RIFCSPHIGHO2_01_FULL_39_95]